MWGPGPVPCLALGRRVDPVVLHVGRAGVILAVGSGFLGGAAGHPRYERLTARPGPGETGFSDEAGQTVGKVFPSMLNASSTRGGTGGMRRTGAGLAGAGMAGAGLALTAES